MAYTAGETITDSVTVVNAQNVPVTGAPASVFTSATVYRPDNTTLTPTLTEVGGGVYDVTFATNAAGSWVVVLVTSSGVTYQGSYDVDAPVVGLTTGAGPTRAEMRVMVGDLLRDHMRLTATTAGSQNTMRDDVNLLDSEDAYLSTMGVVITGHPDNVGKVFRITGSSSAQKTITFDPPLPQPVAAGDIADLYNLGGYGFRLQFYDSDLLTATRMAYPDSVREVAATGTAADGVMAIPAQFVAVFGAEVRDEDEWREIPKSRRAGKWGQGWGVDRANRQVRIDGEWAWLANGGMVRLRGYARHAEPLTDDTRITVDTTWLLYQTASILASRRNSDQQWNNWAVEWGRLASEARQRMATSKSANTVFL